jgi:hypothetical protein
LSHLAAVTAWDVAVDAHVEELTVLWVGVSRVLLRFCHGHLRTRELEDICKEQNRPSAVSASQAWRSAAAFCNYKSAIV